MKSVLESAVARLERREPPVRVGRIADRPSHNRWPFALRNVRPLRSVLCAR
jgi:hypothetical protein